VVFIWRYRKLKDMILATHGIVGSIGTFIPDADYQNVLNYATTQGYTLPSLSQQVKQNKLLVDLKNAGVWSKLDTFAVFATDGNINFALIDWKRLIQYTAVNSPTFSSNIGFAGNSTSAYINTNFNPSTSGVNYTQNDASRIMWGVFPTDNAYPESAGGTTANVTRNGSSNRQLINQSGFLSANSPATWSGTGDRLRALNRTSSTNVEMFGNTTQLSAAATSIALANQNQWILAGYGGFASSTNIFKIYGMGASLVSENTNLYNALNTYINSL
jgi:hypothetical protein